MKKIINGVRYDTESAILIGEYSSPGSSRDFSHWEAGLYKGPRSGRYFLAGEGGPMTRYAKSMGGNSWSGGEDITPMTRDEAFAWAQDFLKPAIVEREFSDAIQDA